MKAVRLTLLVAIGVLLLSAGVAALVSRPAETVPTLQVEVFNACGVDGLAARAGRRLQELRQEVVAVETWGGHEFATSFLIDRRGKPALTRRLAREVGPSRVVLERTEDARADVTLVLGHDWASMRLFGPESGRDIAR